jgi:hypothetical protein
VSPAATALITFVMISVPVSTQAMMLLSARTKPYAPNPSIRGIEYFQSLVQRGGVGARGTRLVSSRTYSCVAKWLDSEGGEMPIPKQTSSWLLVLTCACAGALASSTPGIAGRSGGNSVSNEDKIMLLPRDPDIAIQEEYEAARASDTAAAYRLFIARHPDSALAGEAQKRLAEIGGR